MKKIIFLLITSCGVLPTVLYSQTNIGLQSAVYFQVEEDVYVQSLVNGVAAPMRYYTQHDGGKRISTEQSNSGAATRHQFTEEHIPALVVCNKKVIHLYEKEFKLSDIALESATGYNTISFEAWVSHKDDVVFKLLKQTGSDPYQCISIFTLTADTTNTNFSYNDNVSVSETVNYKLQAVHVTEGMRYERDLQYAQTASRGINSAPASMGDKLQIYPTVATDHINVYVPALFLNQHYTISNQAGAIVKRGKLTSTNMSVDVSDMAKGTYVFSTSDANTGGIKFVKQ